MLFKLCLTLHKNNGNYLLQNVNDVIIAKQQTTLNSFTSVKNKTLMALIYYILGIFKLMIPEVILGPRQKIKHIYTQLCVKLHVIYTCKSR